MTNPRIHSTYKILNVYFTISCLYPNWTHNRTYFKCVIVCSLFAVESYLYRFFIVCLYVLPLEIQLSRVEGFDFIKRFNPAIYVRLSQARTYISNIMCRGLMFNESVFIVRSSKRFYNS